MTRLRLAPAATIIVTALSLSACGGSGDRSQQGSTIASAPAASPARGTGHTAHHPAKAAHRPDTRPRAGAGAAASKATASGGASAANASVATATPQTVSAASATAGGPTFASAADAICGTYRREVSPANAARTLTEQERVFSRVISAARRAISRLHQLSVPAGQLKVFRSFIDHTSAAVDEFASAQARSRTTQESDGVATEEQDFAAFQRAGRDATAGDAAAHRLGLRVCGSPGSDWL